MSSSSQSSYTIADTLSTSISRLQSSVIRATTLNTDAVFMTGNGYVVVPATLSKTSNHVFMYVGNALSSIDGQFGNSNVVITAAAGDVANLSANLGIVPPYPALNINGNIQEVVSYTDQTLDDPPLLQFYSNVEPSFVNSYIWVLGNVSTDNFVASLRLNTSVNTGFFANIAPNAAPVPNLWLPTTTRITGAVVANLDDVALGSNISAAFQYVPDAGEFRLLSNVEPGKMVTVYDNNFAFPNI